MVKRAMLAALTITNLALIDKLELEPLRGLTVLTGETGAGKSMVLDALDLALGGRAEAGVVRAGASACEVVATFEGPVLASLQAVLDEQGIEPDDALVLRRVVKAEGGSRAWLNGTPVPVSVLASVREWLVDIHTQHGTLALANPAAQRAVVDAFHGQTDLVAQTRTAYAAWQVAHKAADNARAAAAKAMAEADLRGAWLHELKVLAYEVGEEDRLAEQRLRVQNAAHIAQALTTADAALNDEGGAIAALTTASKAMGQVAALDASLMPFAQRLDVLLTDLKDAAYDLARTNHDTDGALSLEAIDDRLHALKACARKHGVAVNELPHVLARLQEAEAMASTSAEQLDALDMAARKARQVFEAACEGLSGARAACLPKLHERLHAALADLLMPHARVEVVLTPLLPDNWNAEGAESVVFMLAANPGQPAQPLAKVASGGELSRLMLALKTVFYANLPPQTIILDEIDTGLSGAAAHAVGVAMARLAARHQVVAITHHAQVAAQAAHHWRVSKTTHGTQTTSHVVVLDAPARTEELARLLSGASITEAARAAARELLAA